MSRNPPLKLKIISSTLRSMGPVESRDETQERTTLLEAGSNPGARPSLLGTDVLSIQQQRLDERIRTLCLVVCALAVLAAALFYLQQILVRFVLALALKYLLMPLIQLLSRPIACSTTRLPYQLRAPFKLPHGLAVLIALSIAVGGLGLLGMVVGRSIVTFAANANSYRDRVVELLGKTISATSALQQAWGATSIPGTPEAALKMLDKTTLIDLAKRLNLTEMLMACIGTVRRRVSNRGSGLPVIAQRCAPAAAGGTRN
jgi:hypothetical protein